MSRTGSGTWVGPAAPCPSSSGLVRPGHLWPRFGIQSLGLCVYSPLSKPQKASQIFFVLQNIERKIPNSSKAP